MLIGILMLLGPGVVFVLSLPFSRWLRPSIRKAYRGVGACIVFAGSGVSLYLAFYSGDQGGIAAYFFQLAVITVYLAFAVLLLILNRLSRNGRDG